MPQNRTLKIPAIFLISYGVLSLILFLNQGLPYPHALSAQDQILNALGKEVFSPSESWIGDGLDAFLVHLPFQDPYVSLRTCRLVAVLAVIWGMVIWVWRSAGWLRGMWIGILLTCFLPLRIAGGSIGPQVICLAFLVWGWLLVLTRPWSGTGAAEQWVGGLFLGLAVHSSPWGWLFGLVLPFQGLFNRNFRKRLLRSFWVGLMTGILPILPWLECSRGVDLGIHLETLQMGKIKQILWVMWQGWGFALIPALIGLLLRPKGENRWIEQAILISLPLIAVVGLGYADLGWISLAVPGMAILTVHGIETISRVFVNKTEQKWLATILILLLSYSLFFGGLPYIRQQQAYSHEVQGLAQLVQEKVKPQSPISLFRLNSLLIYLAETQPQKGLGWRVIPSRIFNREPAQILEEIRSLYPESEDFWIDPKRMGEYESIINRDLLASLLVLAPSEKLSGIHTAELVRFCLRGECGISTSTREPSAESR